MPRNSKFRRYTFHTLAAVSLLLMLAIMGSWIDSYSNRSAVTWESQSRTELSILNNEYGVMGVGVYTRQQPMHWYTEPPGWKFEREPYASLAFRIFTKPDQGILGFYVSKQLSPFGNSFYVSAPSGFFALVFGMFPAIWLFKWNKRRRFGHGACASCGYDLTGNETGSCPECGHQSAGANQEPSETSTTDHQMK
jgi:hypothetical protein